MWTTDTLMAPIKIEQALYHRAGSEAPRLLAHSNGFLDEWRPEAEWLIIGFGDPPAGVPCPAAVYAQPLGKQQVAVVQVVEQASGETPHGPTLAFHLLVIPRGAYARFLGDPFAVAKRLPAPWDARGSLPTQALPDEPLPARTIQEVQQVLQRTKGAALPEDADPESDENQEYTIHNAESPALLGGVQVLVDGGRVVFERPRPDTELMHGLWTLLPTSTRCHLWPASFAFGNALGFDALITPRARGEAFHGYTTEEQAAEYPEGRYERSLQIAAEAGDQRELDALFARRSVNETIRLGVALLVVFSVLVLAVQLTGPRSDPVRTSYERTRQRAAVAVSVVGSPSPLNLVGVLPAAQKTWNATIEKEQP
jgi:hypothetical protein